MLTAATAKLIATDNSRLQENLSLTLLKIEHEAKQGNTYLETKVPDMYIKPVAIELKGLGYKVQIMTNIGTGIRFQTLQISWK